MHALAYLLLNQWGRKDESIAESANPVDSVANRMTHDNGDMTIMPLALLLSLHCMVHQIVYEGMASKLRARESCSSVGQFPAVPNELARQSAHIELACLLWNKWYSTGALAALQFDSTEWIEATMRGGHSAIIRRISANCVSLCTGGIRTYMRQAK